MKIRADFSQRVVVTPDDYEWITSPSPGVERMMFDRIGEEVARATSLVRYAPNSRFPKHTHDGGEEVFVLKGTFADEHGVYREGCYLRNPIGTSHQPRIGKQGCLIFVKLHQFSRNDSFHFHLDTKAQSWHQGLVEGLHVLPLHQFEGESVALVRWDPHTKFQKHQHFGGEEILVLKGTFYDEHGSYPQGSWIRSPHLSSHQPYTKEDGALIYVKVGHLLPDGE